MRTIDYEKRKSELRLMIAERGIDGLMKDISDVCKDIAMQKAGPNYMNMWFDRANEFNSISERIANEK